MAMEEMVEKERNHILESSELMAIRLNQLMVMQMLESIDENLDSQTALMLSASGRRELWQQLCQRHVFWIESIEITEINYPVRKRKKMSVFERFVRWIRKMKK